MQNKQYQENNSMRKYTRNVYTYTLYTVQFIIYVAKLMIARYYCFPSACPQVLLQSNIIVHHYCRQYFKSVQLQVNL